MYILAPLALALLFSGCLYKTNTIWDKDVYNVQMSLFFGKSKEDHAKQLRVAVEQGRILPQHADYIMRAEFQGGASAEQAQRLVDMAVDQTRRVRQKMSSGRAMYM